MAHNKSILCSGGADSTLLLVLSAVGGDRNLRAFTFGQSQNSMTYLMRPIFDEIEKLTGFRYPVIEFKGKMYIRPTVERILGIYDGHVYTGCNKVITDKFSPTIYIAGDTPPVRGGPFDNRHIRPFIDMDKVELLSMYKDLGLLHLLSLTRSCGIEGNGRCGGCYFCKEREWAAQQAGIDDINNAYLQPNTT